MSIWDIGPCFVRLERTRFNHSLNLFLVGNSNTHINLDDYQGNLKLAIQCKRLDRWLADHYDVAVEAKYSWEYETRMDALRAFAEFAVVKVGINPYFDMWEELLPMFCPDGRAVLAACQNVYDELKVVEANALALRQAIRAALLKRLDAVRRQLRACVMHKKIALQEKLWRDYKLELAEYNQQVSQICLAQAKVEVLQGVNDNTPYDGVITEDYSFEELRARVKYWRAERARRAAAREVEEHAYLEACYARGNGHIAESERLWKAPSIPRLSPGGPQAFAAACIKRKAELVPASWERKFWVLKPTVEKIKEKNILCGRYFEYLFSAKRYSEIKLETMKMLVENFCVLLDYYPHDRMFEQLCELRESAQMEEAADALFQERQIIDTHVEANGKGILQNMGKFASNTAKFAHTVVANSALYAATYTKAAVVESCKFLFGDIIGEMFNYAKQQFMSIFGGYLKDVQAVHEFVHQMWDKCHHWCESLSDKLSTSLQYLREYSAIALILIMVGGIVVFVERALQSLNVMQGTGYCLNMFLTLFIAYHVGKTASASSYVKELVSSVHGFVVGLFAGNVNDETTARANFFDSVITGMTSIGSCLVKFHCDSIVYAGRVANAFDQLRRGKDALLSFASWVMECLGKIADKITGRENRFFNDLAATVQVDVRSWIKNSRRLLIEAQTLSLGDKFLHDQVERLYVEGEKIQLCANGMNRQLTVSFQMIIRDIMKDLQSLLEKCAHAGRCEGRREEPIWVYIYGEPQCGKTNFMNLVSRGLCDHLDLPCTEYTRTPTDPFWSQYARQNVVRIDDLSAVESSMEGEMINIVSSNPYRLNMASLEEKGMNFYSRIIVTSSNQWHAPLNAGLNTPDAYQERITTMVRVRRRKDAIFDAQDMLAASEFQIADPKTMSPLYPQLGHEGWTTAEEAMVCIKNIAEAKYLKEKQAMEWFRRKCKPVNQYLDASAKFVSKASLGAVLFLSPQQLLKYDLTVAENVLCVCCDSNLYVFGSNYELLHTLKVPSEDAKVLEQASMKTFFTRTQVQIALSCQSDLVEGFLKSLIYGDVVISENLKLPPSASPCQLEFFNENLGTLERVYLRLLQKRVAQINEMPYLNVEAGSWWESVFHMTQTSIQWLKEHGCSILLVVAAIVVVGALLYSFVSAFVAFVSGNGGIPAAIASMALVEAKAVYSSGGMDRTYRARNMPKLYRYTFAKGVAEHSTAADCCAMIVAPRGMNIKAVQYKASYIILTRHQMLSLWDGDEVVVYQTWLDRCTTAIFRKEDCIEHNGSELVHWHCKHIPTLPKHLAELFHIDMEKDIPNYFKTKGYGLEVTQGEFEFKWVDTQAWLNKKTFYVTANMQDGAYRREVPTSIVAEYNAKNFDCGMLFICQIAGKEKIVGVLVAGVQNQSYLNFIPAFDVVEAKGIPDFIPEPQEKFAGFQKQGFLLPAQTPRIPKKNNFVRVPENLADPVVTLSPVPLKEPSVLSSEDERCPEHVDPIGKAVMRKFTEPMMALDQKLLDIVAQEVVESWKDVIQEPLRDVSLHDAINGQDLVEGNLESFVLSTSPGYPYVLSRKGKGKHEYFQETFEGAKELRPESLAHELYANLEEVSSERVPNLVCIECPKDELLKKEKIQEGTCRLFSILPLHFNLFWRVKTLQFTKFIQQSRHVLPCQVGINVNSHEWLRIFDGLEQMGNGKAINCDYSCFDGLLNQQMLICISKMINSLYWEDNCKSLEQRENMLLSLWGRYSIVDNQVLQVFAGLPSGCSLTVILNSIFNELLIRYVFKKRMPEPQRVSFSKYVRLYVYGDDNLIAVHPVCQNDFNGNIIKQELAKYKITITDGSDKSSPVIEFKTLWELDFLKRKFMKNRKGQLVAPLDFASIYSCLVWVRPSKSKLAPQQTFADLPWVDTTEELMDNVNTALFELYIWDDANVFNVVRRFYLSQFANWHCQLRTWGECEALHDSIYTQMSRFKPQVVLDHLITTEDVRVMRNAGPSNFCTPITKELAYAGIAYMPQDDTQVLIAFNGLRASEHGYEVEVEWGCGAGREPTRAWYMNLRKKMLEKGTKRDILPLLKAELQRGKMLVFRDHAPYTTCWLAAVAIAEVSGLADVEELVLLHSNLTGCKGILNSYVNAPWPVIDMNRSWYVNKTFLEYFNNQATVVEFESSEPLLQIKEAKNKNLLPCVLLFSEKGKYNCYIHCDKHCSTHRVASKKSFHDAFDVAYRGRCKSLKSEKFDSKWIKNCIAKNDVLAKAVVAYHCTEGMVEIPTHKMENAYDEMSGNQLAAGERKMTPKLQPQWLEGVKYLFEVPDQDRSVCKWGSKPLANVSGW